MELTRTREHDMLAAAVRRLLAAGDPLATARRALDEGAAVDGSAWQQLVALGVLDAAGPGGEGGIRDLVVVAEELGRALACVPFLPVAGAAAGILCAAARRDPGGPAETWAQRVLAEGLVATVAWLPTRQDPDAVPACRAEPVASGWGLDGEAEFVPFGDQAQLVLVPVVTGHGIGIAAVDARTPAAGIERTPLRTLDATRPQARLRFAGVPATLLLEPDATAVLDDALDRAGILLAAEQLGTAHRALEGAVDYARQRVQFGRQIGSFQAVKHLCADMLIGVESLRSAVRAAAWAIDADAADAPMLASLAQAVAGEVATQVTDAAQHVQGGIGFTWEHDAHLYVRRSLADAAALGGVDEHRLRLADRVGL